MGFLSKSKKHFFILSIDTGGYGSLLPVFILEKLQEELRMQGSSKSLLECFDAIIGAGSGAITTSLLYLLDSSEGQLRGEQTGLQAAMQQLAEHLFDPLEHYIFNSNSEVESSHFIKQKYLSQTLAQLLDKNIMLSDTPSNILIPVLDRISFRSVVLSSETNYPLSLYQALKLATDYAQLEKYNYEDTEKDIEGLSSQKGIKPYEIPKLSQSNNVSLLARNPALLVFRHMREYSHDTHYHILSLGTGSFPQIHPVLDMNQHLLYTSIQTHTSMVKAVCRLLPNVSYHRIDEAVRLERILTAGTSENRAELNERPSPAFMDTKKEHYSILDIHKAIAKIPVPEKKDYFIQLFKGMVAGMIHKAIPILRKYVELLVDR